MSYSARPPLRQAQPRREGPNLAGVALVLGAGLVAIALLFAANAFFAPSGPTGSPGTAATPTEGAVRTEEPTAEPTEPTAEPTETAAPTASESAPPTETAAPTETPAPTASESAPPTETPAPTASATPAGETPTPAPTPTESVAPTPVPTPGPAAMCTGSRDTKDFFESLAQQVDWDVYCAVLPQGWFVDTGEYRLAGGGRLTISYKGPGGARLALKEGFFCTGDTCAPSGTDLGSASFGDRDGTLVALESNKLAISVSPGTPPSWIATGEGLDQVAFTDLAAALEKVQ